MNVAKFTSPELIGNVINWAMATKATNKAAQLQAQSLVRSAYKPITMPRQYYRASSFVDLPSKQAAANVISQGRRISSATADYMPGVQLEAANMANKYNIEGTMAKLADLDKQRGVQENADMAIKQYNIPLLNNYRKSIAGIDSGLAAVSVAKELSRFANNERFVTSAARNISSQLGKVANYDMMKAMNDPELMELVKNYNDIIAEESTLKKN